MERTGTKPDAQLLLKKTIILLNVYITLKRACEYLGCYRE